MNKTLVENQFGHGGKINKFHKIRRVLRPKFSKIGKSSAPVDWNIPYSVERDLASILGILNFKLPVKNQGTSFSCGGQLASQLEAINEGFRNKSFEEKSAKYAYSHIFYPGGGTTTNKLEKLLLNTGVASEKLVSSYENGQPPAEPFMTDLSYENPSIDINASITKDSKIVTISTTNIDEIAQSIRDLNGVGMLFRGQNNGTWLSDFPKPPSSNLSLWGHFIVLVEYKLINGKKYVGALNSWGNTIGHYGIQYFGEEYFTSAYVNDVFGIYQNPPVIYTPTEYNWIMKLLFKYFGYIPSPKSS